MLRPGLDQPGIFYDFSLPPLPTEFVTILDGVPTADYGSRNVVNFKEFLFIYEYLQLLRCHKIVDNVTERPKQISAMAGCKSVPCSVTLSKLQS